MARIYTPLLPFTVLATIVVLAGSAQADVLTVNATNDLYNASGTFDGTAPQVIDVTGGTSITFSVSSGQTVTVNGGTLNDADGAGSASGENDTGSPSISGIRTPTAGFVAGVFYVPGAPLPAVLDFTGPGGIAFTSLSPLLNQAFFIGDGLTGDATGTTQTFNIPVGATSLYLGLTDACGYNGGPSCFGDNSGTFTVTTTLAGGAPAAVPEPASFALLAFGAATIVGWRQRARR